MIVHDGPAAMTTILAIISFTFSVILPHFNC